MPDRITIAVLAAGASRRLGQPKQLVLLDGEPLLRRQCRIALEAEIGPVILILGSQAAECSATIDDLPVTRHVNEAWAEGMASSIRLATAMAMEHEMQALLILQCDQYRVTPQDLRNLHTTWATSNGQVACRARYGDYTGPPVILPACCFNDLLQLHGEQGARGVITSLGKDSVVEVDMPNAVHDLDLPSQLDDL